MRIKDLRRPVLAMTTPCGLGLLVKLPHTQPYRAQEQEGITRASTERAWMAKTTWREPTACLALRHANAPVVTTVILVTLPRMQACHARTRTRAMVARVWMARIIHNPTVAMVNGIAIALTIPPVYYANIAMLSRAVVTEQWTIRAIAPAMVSLPARIVNIPILKRATIMEQRKMTAPASATTNLEETTASTPMMLPATIMEQCALTVAATVMIATLVTTVKRQNIRAVEPIAATKGTVVDIGKICLTNSVNVLVTQDIAETNVKLKGDVVHCLLPIRMWREALTQLVDTHTLCNAILAIRWTEVIPPITASP